MSRKAAHQCRQRQRFRQKLRQYVQLLAGMLGR